MTDLTPAQMAEAAYCRVRNMIINTRAIDAALAMFQPMCDLYGFAYTEEGDICKLILPNGEIYSQWQRRVDPRVQFAKLVHYIEFMMESYQPNLFEDWRIAAGLKAKP